MKKIIILLSIALAFGISALLYTCSAKVVSKPIRVVVDTPNKNTKIQVAILLDTSSSMDGLIEQTKARLWSIVNTLTTLKYQGQTPQIEIALYEYGNNGIRIDDYIRQVTPLTADLDLLSEKLFALTTWGGSEYCGAVIDRAVSQLNWGRGDADMKLIYIAGNEPFTQGTISYKTAINNALESNIYINTIHCGDNQSGINGMWRDGAIRGRGKYFNIDHNVRINHIDTPYDARISEYNHKLNATYIAVGYAGAVKKSAQATQDINARGISSSNLAERAVSKSSSVYKNESWDLVDMVMADEKALSQIQIADLPQELQGKSKEEIKIEVVKKEGERKVIQKQINELAKQRQEYIDNESKKTDSADDLGRAINESILEIAMANGYKVE